MDRLKKVTVVGALLIAAFFVGRTTSPTPKVEIREVERVVYKEQTNYNRDVKRRETIKPDGTRIIEHDSVTRRETETDVKSDYEKTKVITPVKNNWLISVNYEPTLPGLQGPETTVMIQRRILGELYGGLSLTSNRTIGLSFSIGF